LFAQLAAGFTTDDINGGAAGDLIQPRGEDSIRREAARLAGEIGEGGLGDLLGELWRTDLAERGGKNKIEMSPDDFGEGILSVLPGVSPEQLQVSISHFISISSPSKKPDEKKMQKRIQLWSTPGAIRWFELTASDLKAVLTIDTFCEFVSILRIDTGIDARIANVMSSEVSSEVLL
jgi:hypothetical protein